MGCLDETKTLEYGHVFVKTSRTGSNEPDKYKVTKGKLFVAKRPCLHLPWKLLTKKEVANIFLKKL